MTQRVEVGGMFVQSLKFIQRHQGNINNLSIYGQEKNPTTWKLAKMNLAIRSIDGNLGKFADDTFHNDLHKDLKADFVLANPPFNISDWGQEKLVDDARWKYGIPPKGNANFAWVEHMVSKLSMNGKAAIILANGSLSAGGQEEEIRRNLIEADLVDCILSMPSNLFYTVTIPCSIWILNRNKKQKGKTLFIDARNLGTMVTRKLRELNEDDISKIAGTYHNFQNNENYEDVAGYCKASTIKDIKENNYVLTPGRYVGTEEQEDDGIPFEEKMKTITTELKAQFEESHKLEEEIKRTWRLLGMEFKKYRLGEIATFSQGKQVDVKEQYATKRKDMKKFTRIVDYTNASEPVRYVENYGDRYFASEDELVMIRYGSQTAGMAVMGKNGIIANNLFKINLDNDIVLNKYMYYYLSQKEIFNYLRSSQSSSTMPAISFSIMNSLEIDIPSISYQKKSINILQKIDRKIELNNQINDNLQKFIRDFYKETFKNEQKRRR